MSTTALKFFIVSFVVQLTGLAQQEIPMTPWVSELNERRLSVDGRELQHMHLHTTPMYGNSTDFMYYYVTMYFGTHRQPQTLITDTGSSVAAVPCEDYCLKGKCGHHINDLYKPHMSENFSLFDCNKVDCKCADKNRCRFYQGYAEGSRYEGFVAKDSLYFGENFHYGVDMFNYTFGCIHTETKYFYSQEADGILGLSAQRPRMNLNRFEPIYDVMKEQGIIEKRQFAMCLGKNGGYFQIGGYDNTGHLENRELTGTEDITWIKMLYGDADFKVPYRGMMMNNHEMKGTQDQRVAFIDSGTTFTYISTATYNAIKLHFNWFCSLDPENHCKGRMDFKRTGYLCFSYSENEFPNGPYDFFRSFPILRLQLGSSEENYNLDWYPSEYLYREKAGRYCVAVDIQNGSEMIIGGTLMRQHNFVFDIDNQLVGIARASCSHDPNQVKHEQELIVAGQRYALDPTHTESVNEECDHSGSVLRHPRQEHRPDPRPTWTDESEIIEEPKVGPEDPVDKPVDEPKQDPVETEKPVPTGEDEDDDKELAEVDWSSTTIVEEEKDESDDEIDTNLEDHHINNKKPDNSTKDKPTKDNVTTHDESQVTPLENGQEQSLDQIQREKQGGDASPFGDKRNKHASSDSNVASIFISVLITVAVLVGCMWFCLKYCQGRGSHEQVLEPRFVNNQVQYARSGVRDATVADAVTDGFAESSLSSARQNPGRMIRSDRSSDAAGKLELQPDSKEDGAGDEESSENDQPEEEEEEEEEEYSEEEAPENEAEDAVENKI